MSKLPLKDTVYKPFVFERFQLLERTLSAPKSTQNNVLLRPRSIPLLMLSLRIYSF